MGNPIREFTQLLKILPEFKAMFKSSVIERNVSMNTTNIKTLNRILLRKKLEKK